MLDETHTPLENADLDAKVMIAVAKFRIECEDAGITDLEAIVRAHIFQQRPAGYRARVWARVDQLDVRKAAGGGRRGARKRAG